MAKKTRRGGAASLQSNFGSVAARVQALAQQRAAVVEELREVIANAQQMLRDLGESDGRDNARRPRRASSGTAPRKRRKLSPEGRAAIIAAAKKRWAKYHRENKRAS